MRATGIVRRIDDLGRIVIPKEIRRTQHIKEGDPIEIFVDESGIMLQKYSALQTIIDIAFDCVKALGKTLQATVLICDMVEVIAEGGPRAFTGNQKVSPELRQRIQEGQSYQYVAGQPSLRPIMREMDKSVAAIYPISLDSTLYGAIVLLLDTGDEPDPVQLTCLQVAVNMLQNHFEI